MKSYKIAAAIMRSCDNDVNQALETLKNDYEAGRYSAAEYHSVRLLLIIW